MTQRLEFYKCEICGNLVRVMLGGKGELVCCGKPMNLLKASGKEEEKQEKHVPVFLNGVEIQVGSVPHPMTEEHHIEFIECCTSDKPPQTCLPTGIDTLGVGEFLALQWR